MSKINKPPRPPTPGPAHNPSEPIPLKTALEERYLAYALSTIMHRALPDVRDGLKPVHRRILFAMRELKLDPDQAYKKSARIVGDVMGKFHPHGDLAIYDALVRLAQDFATRYPVADGQGNFGNIDGDGAAAMRYTETRMTGVAVDLLDGIDEDTVDFRATYDQSNSEPIVLPAAFPNLLANGSVGIAVGMATNIPPHNADELCAAAIHLIEHPAASIEKLMEFVQGPDFPTGGIVVESKASLTESYRTGRGSIRLRARWQREETGRGTYQIIVTEIPYQVQKGKLYQQIADLLDQKKLPLLGDVRDESAEDIRLVLEPKTRAVDELVLMESLFKLTELEVRFGLNMNVLSRGQVPNVLSLGEVLTEWLAHRREVLIRRSNYRREKIERRLEVLDGFLIAFLNIDEVIRIVRFEDEPKTQLMVRFKLSDVQAEAILNLRLRSLSKLEEGEIKQEHVKLSLELTALKALLSTDVLQWAKITAEIKATRERYSKKTDLGRRRTAFADAPVIDVDLSQAMIEKEPITVLVSDKGWVRAMKGHADDLAKIEFKQGDGLKLALRAHTTDRLLVFASNGRFYTIDANTLPGGRGHGEPLRLMVDIEENHDFRQVMVHEPGRKLLVASNSGYGFVVPEDECIASTRKGRQVLNVADGEEARVVVPVAGNMVATLGDNRKLLIFRLDEVNEMTRGKGVILQRFADGGLADVRVFDPKVGLSWVDSAGRTFTLPRLEYKDWEGQRAQAGKLVPKGFPRSNSFGPAF